MAPVGEKRVSRPPEIDDLRVRSHAKTFVIKLKEPTGLVLLGLGKPSSNVPFIMPKRVAETSASEQISDFTGSGPFIFKRDEWKPGEKVVYVRNDKYILAAVGASLRSRRRQGRKSSIRMEWRAVSDQQQAVNALLANEIDFIEAPPHDLLPLALADSNIKSVELDTQGAQFAFRPNWLHKPFDNPKVRQALLYAFNQEDFLEAVIGGPEFYKVCKSYFPCGTAFSSERGMEGLLNSDFKKAQELLEAGYDGTSIVALD
jgi:peptide/nickel transport system substrate-binding protein